MLKVVLMDDEILALNLLEAMLKEIVEVEIVGVFENPVEGLEKIESINPDVIFLDIEMPELNGIKLAEKIESLTINPEIVFVTAYDHYALEAFNVQAMDYVLKPIDKQRLKKTVERIAKRKTGSIVNSTGPGKITAQFLGSFQLIIHKNEWIKWRTKKAKELTAYLIHHNGPIHRHKIMEDLWPETPVEKAATLLHTTIYQLRKKFRDYGFDDPVMYKGEEYAFTLDLNSDVKQIQTDMLNGDLNHLLDLYNGDYLSQEDYVWSQQESERVRKQVIHTLENYVFEIGDGESKDLYKRVLDKLCDLEPWNERYILKLIDYYVKIGNNKEATNTMKCYKDGLQSELGIEPSKEFLERIKAVIL